MQPCYWLVRNICVPFKSACLLRVLICYHIIRSDFSLNFTVINATGTGQVAVKIFTPPDEVLRAAHFNFFCPRNLTRTFLSP